MGVINETETVQGAIIYVTQVNILNVHPYC